MARSNQITTPRTRSRLMVTAVSACFAASVSALPLAPNVVNGSASFAQSGNVLNVTNSNGAIINWNSFSIGAGETTRFIQASASSSVLNRVLANDPSVIFGTLTSNGKVWLINPAGILVGAGARIDTAGFVASTLNITDANFLANKLKFDATLGAGAVINQGTITTPSGGSVYLVASNVSNTGIITTPQGEVILAAGQSVTLLDTGTPGVSVEIVGPQGNATNLGDIVATAGRIGIAGVLVHNSGKLDASSVVSEGGHVFLKASQDAYVDGNGRIVTTGSKGGKVEVLGNRVAVMDHASIDASGTNGGGTVLIGGDYQGKNPNVQNATATYFGPNATVKADATNNGDGGKVIVWADDTTRAYGHISARGGPNGGNGGFVEVSGKNYLDYQALTDTRAPMGKTGTLLLDPDNISIVTTAVGTFGSYGGSPWVFTANGGTNDSVIGWDTIDSQLGASDVFISTPDGDINILASHTYGSSSNLNLIAGGNVNATNVNVYNTYGGHIQLVAGWNGSTVFYGGPPSTSVTRGTGDITLTNSLIKSTTGSVYLDAGRDIKLDSTSSVIGYNRVRLDAARNVIIGGHVETLAACGECGGSIDITAGDSSYGGYLAFGAGSSIVASRDIDLRAHSGSAGSGDITQAAGGTIALGGSGSYSSYLTADGNLLLDGTVNLASGNLVGHAGYYGAPDKTLRISHLSNSYGGYVTLGATGNASLGVTGDANTSWMDVYGGDNSPGGTTGNVTLSATGNITFGSYGGRLTPATGKKITLSAGGNISGYGYVGSSNNDLEIDAGGNFTLTSGFIRGKNIDMNIGGALDIGSGYGSTEISANGNMNVHAGSVNLAYGGLFGYGDTSLIASGPVRLDHGRIRGLGSVTVVGGAVSLDNHSGIIGYSYYGGGVFVGATSASLNNGSGIVSFGPGSNVEMVISGGDLTLNNDSHIFAGNDVLLTLTGANAIVSLSNIDAITGLPGSPSTIETGAVLTTHINFLSRASGGIFIDGVDTTTTVAGGSGIYDQGNPASPGNGLEITYGSSDNIASIASNTIDQFFNNLTDSNPPPTEDKKKDGIETEGNNQDEHHANQTGTCS